MSLKAAVLCAALGVGALVAQGCSAPMATCSPQNCAGCCDANGLCNGGTEDAACGARGLACDICDTQSQHCALSDCVPGGTGGGGNGDGTGGGSATGGGSGGSGGGSASGGGAATGGGHASGGGTATGGGHATGGGSSGGGSASGGGTAQACTTLVVPGTAVTSALYTVGPMSETTFSVIEWDDSTGRNLLALEIEWSLAPASIPFPIVATVSGGNTSSFVVTFFWQGCTSDLSTCAKTYLIYDGIQTVTSATRGPLGAIAATTATLKLQEEDANGYVLPGTCLTVAPKTFNATYVCASDGNTCSGASDCCANVCTAGICGSAPVCKADGATCASPTDCCTGSCSAGVCGAPVCQVDGTSCSTGSQCCAGVCTSGSCGAPACKVDGASCSTGSQCCTAVCTSGTCGAPACLNDGAFCSTASQCCTGTCSGSVCGGPTCSPNGAFCSSPSTCCTGSCTNGSCGTGTTSCNPVTDTGCSSGNDCILLSSETTTCAIGGNGFDGDSCSASSPCAGGYGCFGGTCRHICKKSTGAGCSSGSTCVGVTGWVTYGACN